MPGHSAPSILIVGGGIAGLTLAIALARHDIQATIVEISPQPDVLGVGLSLTGPTLRALGAIGLRDACVDAAFGFSQIPVFDAHGNTIDTVMLPPLNGPNCPGMVAIERRALHDVLLRAVDRAGLSIRFATTVASISETSGGAYVALSDGSHATFDLVVGADGLHSGVRALAFPDAPAPHFAGVAIWRAALPRPPEVRSMQLFYGPRNKAGLNPVSEAAMFLFLVEVVPDRSRIAPDQLPGRLSAQLDGYAGILAHVSRQLAQAAPIDYRPMESILVSRPWYRGRVLLIGDAAHTTTPHLATGAGIAIEDAVVLAELVASGAPVPVLLEAFMERRFQRCRLVVETALQLAEWEKDAAIPPRQHIDLMRQTFARLAQPI
jgi:2-polyprenyl-6-methoxyphenol hydroxylase-like FAD-dependent oxidoreductase